jgi:hypothetical protein
MVPRSLDWLASILIRGGSDRVDFNQQLDLSFID